MILSTGFVHNQTILDSLRSKPCHALAHQQGMKDSTWGWNAAAVGDLCLAGGLVCLSVCLSFPASAAATARVPHLPLLCPQGAKAHALKIPLQNGDGGYF